MRPPCGLDSDYGTSDACLQQLPCEGGKLFHEGGKVQCFSILCLRPNPVLNFAPLKSSPAICSVYLHCHLLSQAFYTTDWEHSVNTTLDGITVSGSPRGQGFPPLLLSLAWLRDSVVPLGTLATPPSDSMVFCEVSKGHTALRLSQLLWPQSCLPIGERMVPRELRGDF